MYIIIHNDQSMKSLIQNFNPVFVNSQSAKFLSSTVNIYLSSLVKFFREENRDKNHQNVVLVIFPFLAK